MKKERCSVVPRGPAVPEEENYRVVRRLMQDGRARVAAAGPRASDDARPMRAPPTRHPSRRNRRRAIAWPTHTDRLRPLHLAPQWVLRLNRALPASVGLTATLQRAAVAQSSKGFRQEARGISATVKEYFLVMGTRHIPANVR